MLSDDTSYDSPLERAGKIVATLVTHDRLKVMIEGGQIIVGGDVNAVEGIKYDFRLGSKFLKASLERPVDFNDLHGTERLQAKIVGRNGLHKPDDLRSKRRHAHGWQADMGKKEPDRFTLLAADIASPGILPRSTRPSRIISGSVLNWSSFARWPCAVTAGLQRRHSVKKSPKLPASRRLIPTKPKASPWLV